MYKVKIWDKIESINGVDAKNVIKSHRIKETDDIFLVLNNYDRVLELNFVEVIRNNFNLSKNLTKEEVAKEYLKIKEEEKLQAEKEANTFEEMVNKISILEAKNKRLEEGLQAVLSGDMQSLAYILYPEDFADINNTTLEL